MCSPPPVPACAVSNRPRPPTPSRNGARLVDTRPQFQRQADGEIPGAIVIERNHLEWRLDPTSAGRIPEATDHDIAWIVLCDEGYSSSLAAASLQRLGLRNATDVISVRHGARTRQRSVSQPGTCARRVRNDRELRLLLAGGHEEILIAVLRRPARVACVRARSEVEQVVVEGAARAGTSASAARVATAGPKVVVNSST